MEADPWPGGIFFPPGRFMPGKTIAVLNVFFWGVLIIGPVDVPQMEIDRIFTNV